MIFNKTKIEGVYTIDIEKREDDRGYFARCFCQKEFEEVGLKSNTVQHNLSHNYKKGTLRGMHFQVDPYQEVKIIRCTKGAIWDVIVDLRKNSPTYKQWVGVELSEENHRMFYVPEDFAHGYITLTEETEVHYLVTQFYQPNSEGGLRYNDPAFGIEWPTAVECISDKDKNWPDFSL